MKMHLKGTQLDQVEREKVREGRHASHTMGDSPRERDDRYRSIK